MYDGLLGTKKLFFTLAEYTWEEVINMKSNLSQGLRISALLWSVVETSSKH